MAQTQLHSAAEALWLSHTVSACSFSNRPAAGREQYLRAEKPILGTDTAPSSSV